MSTLRSLVRRAAAAFAAAGIADARLEAEWLCDALFGASRLERFGEPSPGPDPAAASLLDMLVHRRVAGEPLQYVLASAEFYSLPLAVGPGVLIPRPETEGLVALAVARYRGPGPVCDLCTGSGAVALALARELPPATPVFATDLSPAALRYARRNARELRVATILFLEGDLFAPLPPGQRFRVVTANPPYIATAACATLPHDVRGFEPHLALHGGADGLDPLRRIVATAPAYLAPQGWLLCEIDEAQAPAAAALFAERGLAEVRTTRDSFGRERFVAGRAPDAAARSVGPAPLTTPACR